jgi:elongation factor 1-beta
MASFKSVEELNKHLATRSYVNGYNLSADDKTAMSNLKAFPCAKKQPHAYRWALHVSALTMRLVLLR